jgi:hypothetical protein
VARTATAGTGKVGMENQVKFCVARNSPAKTSCDKTRRDRAHRRADEPTGRRWNRWGRWAGSFVLGFTAASLVLGNHAAQAWEEASRTSQPAPSDPGNGAESGATGDELTDRARHYVQALGDPDYARREQARQQLLALGLPALAALEQGRNHPDREIRYGARRLLATIQQHDFQRRLDLFAADVGSDRDYGLPGWGTFRESFGESPTSRGVFVEMLRAEAGLMQALDEGERAVSSVLGLRIQQLQQAQARPEPIPVGGIAAMLFVAGHSEASLPPTASQTMFQACFQAQFHAAMTEGPQQRILRPLLAQVIRQADDWPAYLALQLAMRYDLPEGLVPAERTLKDQGGNRNLNFIRQFAILTVAKFGDSTHTPLLERLLVDDTPCSSMTINQVRYETQIRDIALASLWKIIGEDPSEHGFGGRIQRHAQNVFNTGTLGFANDIDRENALRKWYERAE